MKTLYRTLYRIVFWTIVVFGLVLPPTVSASAQQQIIVPSGSTVIIIQSGAKSFLGLNLELARCYQMLDGRCSYDASKMQACRAAYPDEKWEAWADAGSPWPRELRGPAVSRRRSALRRLSESATSLSQKEEAAQPAEALAGASQAAVGYS